MSTTADKSSEDFQDKKPSLVQINASFKLIIPTEVEKKIRYLCAEIPDVEWSGTLFYRYKGSWEDEDLEITCVDIFVMDIGSSAYTEFDVSPDVVSYMCDHPELMECQMGLIHSHNKMSTFFSGTDTATLRDEGSRRNHFVSLIVNNAGVYTAGITRKIEYHRETQEGYSYGTFNDSLETGKRMFAEEGETIEWSKLEIIKETSGSEDFSEIEDRLKEIRESKQKVSEKSKRTYKEDFHNPGYWGIQTPKQLSLFDDRLDDPSYRTPSKLPRKLIRSSLLQLLTGSLVIADDSKIDPTRWAKTMEKVFDKRFSTIKTYRTCAEAIAELIVLYPPEELGYTDEFLYAEEISEAMIKELKRLPRNKYINELIDIMQTWLTEL